MSAEENILRFDALEDVDFYGEECIRPTFWIGHQGFDLTEKYSDSIMSAKERTEWHFKNFKSACEHYHKKKIERELDEFEKEIKIIWEVNGSQSNDRQYENMAKKDGARYIIEKLRQ